MCLLALLKNYAVLVYNKTEGDLVQACLLGIWYKNHPLVLECKKCIMYIYNYIEILGLKSKTCVHAQLHTTPSITKVPTCASNERQYFCVCRLIVVKILQMYVHSSVLGH